MAKNSQLSTYAPAGIQAALRSLAVPEGMRLLVGREDIAVDENSGTALVMGQFVYDCSLNDPRIQGGVKRAKHRRAKNTRNAKAKAQKARQA